MIVRTPQGGSAGTKMRYLVSGELKSLLGAAEAVAGRPILIWQCDTPNLGVTLVDAPQPGEPHQIYWGPAAGEDHDASIAWQLARLIHQLTGPAHPKLYDRTDPVVARRLIRATIRQLYDPFPGRSRRDIRWVIRIDRMRATFFTDQVEGMLVCLPRTFRVREILRRVAPSLYRVPGAFGPDHPCRSLDRTQQTVLYAEETLRAIWSAHIERTAGQCEELHQFPGHIVEHAQRLLATLLDTPDDGIAGDIRTTTRWADELGVPGLVVWTPEPPRGD